MKKLLLLLFSILISLNALSLDFEYKDYKKNPSLYSDYLYGLESGMSWYGVANSMLNDSEKFYCQPGNLALGLDTVQNIIDSQVKQFIDDGLTQAAIDEMPIGMILLYGLSSTFPCN